MRKTLFVTIDGETLPLLTVCERFNLSYGAIIARRERGLTLQAAVEKDLGGQVRAE